MRVFETGATRSNDAGKIDYEAYLSPMVIEAFGRYMLKHEKQADGSRRSGDNWQKGIPKDEYLKSAWRHFWDWWALHRSVKLRGSTTMEDAICALLFNAMGYLHEYLKSRHNDALSESFAQAIQNLHQESS
ncbi:MAG TPA: dATP/dGTP diphosphohydrolase domain-containing protein [Terriglobia bacterium]|nr:dATP/dGTP diphosphohydrolase domain-containing protein [Terriglobia bacterium]